MGRPSTLSAAAVMSLANTLPCVPSTDRLQCQEGIRGIFGRVFCWSHCGRPSTCLATPHGPTALVLAQEAEDDHLLPARVFAPFRHNLHTPASQGRAGASFNRRAKRLHLLAHRALVLALTAGVHCGGRKKGHYARFPLTLCLVDRATLAVTPTPPQSLLPRA